MINVSRKSAVKNVKDLVRSYEWVCFILTVDIKIYINAIVTGKLCIEVEPNDKLAWISEELCIGCGICVKKCPFEAINIINLPSNLEKQTTHRYNANSFKLHRYYCHKLNFELSLVA